MKYGQPEFKLCKDGRLGIKRWTPPQPLAGRVEELIELLSNQGTKVLKDTPIWTFKPNTTGIEGHAKRVPRHCTGEINQQELVDTFFVWEGDRLVEKTADELKHLTPLIRQYQRTKDGITISHNLEQLNQPREELGKDLIAQYNHLVKLVKAVGFEIDSPIPTTPILIPPMEKLTTQLEQLELVEDQQSMEMEHEEQVTTSYGYCQLEFQRGQLLPTTDGRMLYHETEDEEELMALVQMISD